MPQDEGQYAIGDLAALAGTTARTVRYYVAQGLLPAPVGTGPGAHYTEGHLARLRLIRRLQRQHQPLSEIRQRLASLGEDDVTALLAQADRPEPPPGNSALDYVRSLLAAQSPPTVDTNIRGPVAAPLAPVAAPLASAAAALTLPLAPGGPVGRASLRRSFAMPRMKDVPAAEPPAPNEGSETAPAELRSQWDHIAITPNIEIHVRRPLGRLENRRVERLITIARQVLREEQP